MARGLLLIASWLAAGALAGCGPDPPPPAPESPQPQGPAPLAVQQKQAYPEAVTGGFISMVDFENAPGMPPGRSQVDRFEIVGAPPGRGETSFALNITRTGAGAMRVLLPRGAQLVYNIPDVQDFRGYTLLSASIYTDAPRDDLRVSLITPAGEWSSPRKLLTGGWTTVLVDLQQLAKLDSLDFRNVEKIVFWLASPAGQLQFYLDDILLIDNRRRLDPTPEGMTVHTRGLDLLLRWAPWPGEIVLSPGSDGLWRFERFQPELLLGPRDVDEGASDPLAAMGEARIGRVERLELGPGRIRLANTWYFPSRLGEWVSLGIRRVRWEYTFYPDGRWVTDLLINNAGGPEIQKLHLRSPRSALWRLPTGQVEGAVPGALAMPGPIYHCAMQMTGPENEEAEALQEAYARPGRLKVLLGLDDRRSPGDRDKDGFDESQGCYRLRARNGYCRFRLEPEVPLVNPVFVVEGISPGPVSIHADGLAIRDSSRTPAGALLFRLPGRHERPVSIEISPVEDAARR